MKSPPHISIILPTYNRAHYLAETLSSIIVQTYKNWECLIIDDGSIDNTKEVLEPYLAKDVRFKYYDRTAAHKKGPSGCRNQGIDLSQGEYIIFFDSDDIVHPKNLDICYKVILKDDFQFCRYDKSPFWGEWNEEFDFNDADFEIQKHTLRDLQDMITMKSGFACCTVMWKKTCFNGLKFNEELSYAEEWEFYARLLSQDISGASINKSLYFNRKHPNSNTGEFRNNDPVRRASKIKATTLVVDNLKQKKLLTPSLVKYFIQLAFSLKSFSLLDHILNQSEAGILKTLKYKLGYAFYPVLRPVLKIKGKILRH